VLLNTIASLDKKAKDQVWNNIANDLGLGLKGKIKKTLKLWHTLFLLIMALFFNPQHTNLIFTNHHWTYCLNRQLLVV
jgi:hypothetical protein